jgi:prophage antirepressor-like protein
MSDQLTIFDFEENAVRVIDHEGSPWFVAADVCRVLELSNPTETLRGLDEDERMTLSNTEGHSGQRGGAQMFNIISESGLYALIFKSRKEEAKKFRKWITAEVIPAIRKTGKYEAPVVKSPLDEEVESNDGYLDTLRERLDYEASSVSDMMREVMYLSRQGNFPQERSRVICALGGRALEAMRFRLDLHNAGNTKNLPASA